MTKTHKNLILVSGTGQNVGKTTFVCMLIEKFKKQQVIALKISPYWHNINNEKDIIVNNGQYMILRESNNDGNKDSSKMHLSGAFQTYYIQATDKHIPEAFNYLNKNFIKNQPVICESSALGKHFTPAFHFVITKDLNINIRENKSTIIRVQNTNNMFDFDFNSLILDKNNWHIKQ